MPERPAATDTASDQDQELLALARERFEHIQTAEDHIRKAALEDIRFTYNVDEGQWDAAARKERETDGRPCLTANKLRKFVAIVANQERENRIAGKIRPVDDQSDPVTARILEDLIRQIEYASDAETIFASAGEQAAAGGAGYWRILTRFPEDGFDQEIVLQHVDNPFAVYLDPRRQYGFIADVLPEAEFKREYPNARAIDFSPQGLGEAWTLWYLPGKVRVAEYFVKEPVTRTLAQVRNPLTGQVLTVELRGGVTREELLVQGLEIIRERRAPGHRVRWYKITGAEVLERRDWPGREIPIIEVVGDRVNIDGKVYKRSLIRDGKDPQRAYNYWITTETETVALQPKAPYLVTPQEISGHEVMWDEANRKNHPYLLFNPQGQRIPKRETPPQVSSGHLAMLNRADADIKDTLGMFESFLGEASNERSGRAIFARERRSQVGVFHFPDNLRRAVVETTRQLIDLIPRVYDTERIVRIRGEQGGEELIAINQTVVDSTGRERLLHDLSLGKYDVVADVRQYSTRRQETVELIIAAMQYAPVVAPVLAALLFKYVDAAGAQEIEQEIRQFLSQLQANGGEGGGQPARNGTAPGAMPVGPSGRGTGNGA